VERGGTDMTTSEKRKYDLLVFDGARNLAVAYRNDTDGMRTALQNMNAPIPLINEVIREMNDPAYKETNYRGEMCDEAVIEALKDILRHIYGFVKFEEELT
jgi:hypothetical protein